MEQTIWHIAICEDDLTQQRNLYRMVSRWCESHGYIAKILMFAKAEALLFAWEEEMEFDVLLLDIDFGKECMNGMELARKIRQKDEYSSIIFITALKEYMNQGYDVRALHFLVKPLEEGRLWEVLDVVQRSRQAKEKFILLELDGQVQRIAVSQIVYAEAFSHSIVLHFLKNKEHFYQEYKLDLKELEHQLLGQDFFRCHRSYLIALSYVCRIGKGEVVLENNIHLPMGRTKEKKLYEAFLEYHKRTGGILNL